MPVKSMFLKIPMTHRQMPVFFVAQSWRAMHIETVDGLKDEIETLKADSEKRKDTQQKLSELEAYKPILKEGGIGDSIAKLIIAASDDIVDGTEIEDGNVKDRMQLQRPSRNTLPSASERRAQREQTPRHRPPTPEGK